MPLEIERRFLVSSDEWKKVAKNTSHFYQGYLISNLESWIVRVRVIEQKSAYLTLKTKAEGISNHEFEYLIPLKDANSLLKLAAHKLRKTRYELNIKGGDWIIDCFEGSNFPLVIAEVELTSETQKIEKPVWCHTEITNNKHFSNAALARTPISDWPIEKRLTKIIS